MGFFIPIGIALGVSGGGLAAGVVGGLAVTTALSSVAGAGVSIAQASGAFDPPSPPKPPARDEVAIAKKVESSRRRAVVARAGKGRRQTLLTQRAGAPSAQTRTLLG